MKKIIVLSMFLLATAGTYATTVYVKPNASGDGSSWANASGDLQAMINVSAANDQIWVAAGTYKPVYTADGWNSSSGTYPTTDGNRDNAFVLKEGVKIYGGFAGTETDIAQRTLSSPASLTVLSGDIGTAGNNADNCYHVVIGAGNITAATILDGFTITGGNANGSNDITVNGQIINRNHGGGIYNRNNSSPTLTNLTISGNSTGFNGGGIYNNYKSSPTLTNVTISGNSSSQYGGGIYNYDSSSPTLINLTISGNKANNGGGIYNNDSSPTLTNVTISGNTAASYGGGIYNYYSNPKINNSIIWGNTASTGVNIYNSSSSSTPTYEYSLVEGSGGSGSSGWGSFGTDGGNNIDGNPLFEDWQDPASATMPNTTGDYTLQAGSPAINNGDNTVYLTARSIANFTDEKDLAGIARLSGTKIDMGAYEYQLLTPIVAHLNYTLPATVVYNGAAQPLTVTAATGVTGLGAITVKYNGSATAPTDADTYTISVSIAEGAGYAATVTDLVLTGDYKINPLLHDKKVALL